jgi:cysteine desulfurase family protein (TIGR01976 family)
MLADRHSSQHFLTRRFAMQFGSIINSVRAQFPALSRTIDNQPAVYFDGPAGSQVPQAVINAVTHYYTTHNANSHGDFATARESDAALDAAALVFADFFYADDPLEIVWGANMTSMALAMSRTLAKTWSPGDEVIVSQLDHDANFTPWVMAAERVGAVVKRIPLRKEDCTLDIDAYQQLLSPRTKFVALGCASNAVGTINPVEQMTRMAKQVGALVWLDAVHFAPHDLPDVQRWGCDFAIASAYKFFGPHLGILWAKSELLHSLQPDKIRPAPNTPPGRWMTGTQAHELIVGAAAAVDYLAGIGRQLAPGTDMTRRAALLTVYQAIKEYEQSLATRFLQGVSELKQVRVWGITDHTRISERVATFSISHARLKPCELVEMLDRHGIFAWHGNFYAVPWSEAMGLEPDGVTRVGFLHYNTSAEVDRLLAVLCELE